MCYLSIVVHISRKIGNKIRNENTSRDICEIFKIYLSLFKFYLVFLPLSFLCFVNKYF